MAEQFLHKYVLEFGQPVSFYSAESPTGVGLLSATTSQTNAIQYANVKADGAIRLTQHNLTFSIVKGKDSTKETTFSIYNISDNVRKFLEQNNGKKPMLVFRAGYETELDVIANPELPILFAGEVIQVTDTFNGTTRKTDITCASGTTAIQEAYSIKSYRAGTKPSDIVRQVMKDLKLPEGTVYFPANMEVAIQKPVVYTGPSIEFLRKFGKEQGIKVWIEDGAVNAVPTDIIAGSYTKAFKINSVLNMIGSPSVKTADVSQTENSSGNRQNITVKTTLNGAYSIGAKVVLESKYHNGSYEIESVQHDGTYEGDEWSSTLELKPIDGWEKEK
jgi:hypothetical protein